MQHEAYGAGLNSDQPCNTSVVLGLAIEVTLPSSVLQYFSFSFAHYLHLQNTVLNKELSN